MHNHAPDDYHCFVCETVAGRHEPGDWNQPSDVVYRDGNVTGWINERFWGRNAGHVVLVPNAHHENIYDLPLERAVEVQEAARRVALTLMSAYGCDGTSTRQHNGPAANQEAFHFHTHVFPRFKGDRLYDQSRRPSTPADRLPYAERFRAATIDLDERHLHEPDDYDCPFCMTVSGKDRDDLWSVSDDVIAQTDGATAWISPAWWPNNEGHVLVVPNAHLENIYCMTPELSAPVLDLARRVATAMMDVYGCEGTSTRQHNGPGGDQEVWHYHMHVFPRYTGDGLYGATRRRTTADERKPYVQKLRAAL